MLDVFLNAIAPIFSVVFIGYAMRKAALFDAPAASMVNRFVFFVALPVLLFRLIATTPIDAVDWRALGVFLGMEAVVYALGFALARLVLRRSVVESLLLGVTAALANHVFLVLPIGHILFGDAVGDAITAIILMDSVILFGVSVVLVDLASSGSASPAKVLASLVTNPPLIGIALALVVSGFALTLHPGLLRFTEFLGAAAAPAALFALGVILADRPAFEEVAAPAAVSAIKLAAAPALAYFAFQAFAPDTARPVEIASLLVAAGPCGAMGFVIGMRFGAPVATVSRAVLMSTALAAGTLTLLAASLG